MLTATTITGGMETLEGRLDIQAYFQVEQNISIQVYLSKSAMGPLTVGPVV